MDCAYKKWTVQRHHKNFRFLDYEQEITAIDCLLKKCRHVVITPDQSSQGQALLHHTSCARMADVVNKIFADRLETPASLPHGASEMTVGELHRRSVTLPDDDCRERISRFGFTDLS